MDSPGDGTRFLPERALPDDARLYLPADDVPRDRPFAPLPVAPPPSHRGRTRIAFVGSAVALVTAAVVGMAFWLLWPSPATSTSPTNEPAPPSAEPDGDVELLHLLPPGYPAGSCRPVAPPKETLAQVFCDTNSDSGGEIWASYTLLSDKTALEAAFNDIVNDSDAVVCPGNIQSPGPWRRNATPDKISGVLVCCVQDGRPMVAWTDDDKRVLSTVKSHSANGTLPSLYTWWSAHS